MPGRPTIWMIVGQRPIALAVGAGGGGGGCLDIFTLLYPFSPISPSLGDGPIYTEILSQRAATPKTTNQLTLQVPETKTAEFANSVDLDEVAHYKPPHLDLHYLPSSF